MVIVLLVTLPHFVSSLTMLYKHGVTLLFTDKKKFEREAEWDAHDDRNTATEFMSDSCTESDCWHDSNKLSEVLWVRELLLEPYIDKDLALVFLKFFVPRHYIK